MLKGLNKYDYILILLIASTAFGCVGGALQVPRIISIIVVPILFFDFYNIRRNYKLILYLLLMLVYGCLSIAWSTNKAQGLIELCVLFIHILLLLEIVFCVLKSEKALFSVCIGWLLFAMITIPIAFMEILYDVHLGYARSDVAEFHNNGFEVYQKIFASVTFYNYNDYSMHLCLSQPFILSIFLMKSSNNLKTISLIVYFSVVYIILMNSSRSAMLCTLIYFVIFCYFLNKSSVKYKKLVVSVFVIVVIVAINLYGLVLFEQFSYRFSGGREFFEDSDRINLIQNSLVLLKNTYGLGVGLGSITEQLAHFGGTELPHNMLLEFVLNLGIILLIPLICFFIKAFYCLCQDIPQLKKFIISAVLFSMPFYSVTCSSYFKFPAMWILFGLLYYFVIYGKLSK